MSDKRYSYCKFTIEEEKIIIQDYQEGLSLAAVGRKWHCDPSTVKNILKAYNVSTRNYSEARRQFLHYTLNEDIFDKIDIPEKAYWLGVMYSDGYISKTKYTNKFGISVSWKNGEL